MNEKRRVKRIRGSQNYQRDKTMFSLKQKGKSLSEIVDIIADRYDVTLSRERVRQCLERFPQ